MDILIENHSKCFISQIRSQVVFFPELDPDSVFLDVRTCNPTLKQGCGGLDPVPTKKIGSGSATLLRREERRWNLISDPASHLLTQL